MDLVLSNRSETVPAWAMKLIADAQIPNGRWVKFKSDVTVKQVLDWCMQSVMRVAIAKVLMRELTRSKKNRC